MSTNKRIAKRFLSAILTMLMLMSMVTIGMASASAATLELAETGANLTGGEVLYLKPSSNWQDAGARFAVYFFNDTTKTNTWVDMTKVNDPNVTVYEVTAPTGDWEKLIFCRMNPGAALNDWTNKWNQTGDLTWNGTNNCFTVPAGTWDGATTTWSTYTPPVVIPEYSVTFNDGHFKVTGDAKVTEGEDYTFTVEATTGFEVTKVTCNDAEITAVDGTYTVADVKADLNIEITVSEIVTYSVMFIDYNGTVISSENVEEGTEVKIPADPTRAGYFFTGWNPAPDVTRDDETGKWITVTENAVFTAQYKEDSNDTPIITPPTEEEEEETSKWTVMFVDYDNTLLKIAKVEDGKAAEAPEAPERAGYTFTGWSQKFDNVTADLLVVAQYKQNEVTPPAPATIGKLQVEVSGGTGFTINGRPQGTSYLNTKMAIGTSVTLEAKASSDATFIGWLNASNNLIITTDTTYTFIATGNDSYKALYLNDIEGVNIVRFMNDKSKQILDMQYYASGETVEFPAYPGQAGYKATGWNMTAEQIEAELAAGNDVTVCPTWERVKVYVNLTVNNGTVTEPDGPDGTYVLAGQVTAVAATAADGKKFAYWIDETGAIKSYDSEYTFYVVKNTELTPVYVGVDDAIDYQILVSVDAIDTVSDASTNATYYSWYVPTAEMDIKYVKNGVVSVNKANYNPETFVAGTTDTNVYDRGPSGIEAVPVGARSWTKSNVAAGDTWMSRAYVQYMINGDETNTVYTVYSDIVEATRY